MKRAILSIFLTCITFSFLFADLNQDGVQLTLKEVQHQIYTLDTSIQLQLDLMNESPDPYLFELAGNKVFNLEVEVSNLYNEELPASEKYIREKTSNQQVYYREIRLLPGEQFSFTFDLSQFTEIRKPGIYFIQASFSPHLGQQVSLDSNTLTIHLYPTQQQAESAEAAMDMEKEEVLQKYQLPPDQVVEYTLHARQREEWEKFFLYLDVEELMLQNPLKKAQYRRSPEERRLQMVSEYRELLQNEVVDEDILLKPSDFQILKTEYTPEAAEVLVTEEFQYPDFTEKRRYVYYLHRPEGFWIIHKYQVMGQETQ